MWVLTIIINNNRFRGLILKIGFWSTDRVFIVSDKLPRISGAQRRKNYRISLQNRETGKLASSE